MDSLVFFIKFFVCSALLGSLFIFLPGYFRSKRLKELFLSLASLSFFIYIAATLALQFFVRYGRPHDEIFIIQKVIAVSLIFGSLFIFLLINTRFKKGLGIIIVPFFVLAFLGMIWATLFTTLIKQETAQLIFFVMWGLLGIASFISIFGVKRGDVGQKVLYFYTFLACSLFVAAYMLFVFSSSLITAWVFILLGSVGVALGEGIDKDSQLARNPLNYFRSRLLFKVIFGFVSIIIIVFGATHIFTMELTKSNLQNNIYTNYRKAVNELALDISSFGRVDLAKINKTISSAKVGSQSNIYVVDFQGRLLAKAPSKNVVFKKNLRSWIPVKNLLNGKFGSGEFVGENGVSVVGAYRPIRSLKLGIIIEQPAAIAYKQIDRIESDSLLFVIAGMGITVLLGFIFAGTIERPLRKITQGTQAIAAGDLSYHINTRSIDELGNLAEAYNRMTDDLRETQNRLIVSEKMIALGNMAAGMAHEIRNPLVSLRTFTQLMAQKWEDQNFRDKFLTIVPREIERINRIAESLLKFGRPWQAEVKEVSINSVLEEVLLLFEPEMKKKNVNLNTKLADAPSFKGDAPQLVQAFTNIVKNAIEAVGDKGGGDLNIETEYILALKLKTRGYSINEMTWGHRIAEKPYIMVRIHDAGGGVPEGKLQNLFDPFFTSKTYGTGMGLPITLRIIEEHRGTIKVKNRPGEGTTFVIYLPQEGR